jgi:hypothetical protein
VEKLAFTGLDIKRQRLENQRNCARQERTPDAPKEKEVQQQITTDEEFKRIV